MSKRTLDRSERTALDALCLEPRLCPHRFPPHHLPSQRTQVRMVRGRFRDEGLHSCVHTQHGIPRKHALCLKLVLRHEGADVLDPDDILASG